MRIYPRIIQGSFRFHQISKFLDDQAVSAVMFWVVYFLLRYFEIICDILWWFIAQFCRLSVWQVFIVAEHVFCTYFFLEWWIRFGAFESKRSLAASSKIRALITSDPTDDGCWFPTLGHPQIISNMVAILVAIHSQHPHFALGIPVVRGECLRDFWLLFDGFLMFVTVFEPGIPDPSRSQMIPELHRIRRLPISKDLAHAAVPAGCLRLRIGP